MPVIKKQASEDNWVEQAIGAPLVSNPVQVPDQYNMYVARHDRDGLVYFGRAWNESGVTHCEFACGEEKLDGSNISDKIRILTYDGNHITKGFFYEWMKFAKWLHRSNDEFRIPLRCGTSSSVIFCPENGLGTLNIEKKTATFVCAEKIILLTESELYDCLILVRNLRDRPPHCCCEQCLKIQALEKETHSSDHLLMVNEWVDYCVGDTFPKTKRLIKALNRPLNTLNGPEDQYVALWYHFGQAIMGRAWSDANGKIAAAFVSRKMPFLSKVIGSLQLLVQIPPSAAGFDYSWQPYNEAAKIGSKEWNPVHIGFASPCVLVIDKEGHEYLGSADLKEEFATTVIKNKVFRLEGHAIYDFKVLCRKDRDDTQAI
uniref:HET domain-containing protein n=1 Tax=Elaeophora elaphi TaxID=1147741 RepID=A0A0R3RWC6_9BILA